MASKAILRRRKLISDYLNASVRPIQSFQNFGNGRSGNLLSSKGLDSQGSSSAVNNRSLDFPGTSDGNSTFVAKDAVLSFSSLGLLRRRYSGTMASVINGRSEFIAPTGFRFMSQSVRYASTAAAGQHDLGSDDEENEELAAKRRKEASPQECDQAVEGLSTAKAKAKAKQKLESQKSTKSLLQKTWAMLLGIGPALRAVASMSRLNFFFLCI